jgi:hypothetical protein
MGVLCLNYNKHYFGNFVVRFACDQLYVGGRYGNAAKKLRPFFLVTKCFFFIYKQYFKLFLSLLNDMLVGTNFK